MSEHRFEYDARCGACRGTGIYVGMAERAGAGVVCHKCKGTGAVHCIVEWDDAPPQPIVRDDILRVLRANPGIVIGEDEMQGLRLADFGGLPYAAWLRGEPFPPGSEMRRFTCPAWWYQLADYKRKPDWDECIPAGSFSRCKHFPNKAACWARWDAEHRDG